VNSAPAGGLLAFLAEVPDPRRRQGRRHPLAAMLAVVVCAVLCGHDNPTAFADWIKALPPAWWHALGFFRKPPHANSYRKLLARLVPEHFQEAISKWLQAIGLPLSQQGPCVIDGKWLRGAIQSHGRALQTLTVLDQATGGVLKQAAVPDGTNEAKAALELLKSLVLKGRVIVADAAYCQRDVCQTILDSGGDYLVVVKDNQPTLKRDLEAAFANPEVFSPLRTSLGA
jgi:hypothetical protein